ncbi:MAG: hypothetical protein VB067_14815 [Christensenellaceae bacterium]|nr:hypothetical protein [Christensenellaceae bacterium]MEA5070262.1 hypothetical protein [Christensenellaceae bacterium]
MKFTIDAKTILTAVTNVSKACAKKDAARTILTGVEICCTENAVTLTALDGFQMAQTTLAAEDTEPGSAIVHPARLIPILRMAGKGYLQVELDTDQLCVWGDDFSAAIQVMPGQYIAHAQLWPSENRRETSILVNPEYLIQMARAVGANGTVRIRAPLDPTSPIELSSANEEGPQSGRALVLPIKPIRENPQRRANVI